MSPDKRCRQLLRHVKKNGDCWEWAGRVNPGGYGRLGAFLAHRVSYQLLVGPIGKGLTVDHLCFNTLCVCPDHLRLLTMKENRENQRAALKTHCIAGHEFTDENTYRRPQKYRGGKRGCRACQRAAVARYAARKKVMAA